MLEARLEVGEATLAIGANFAPNGPSVRQPRIRRGVLDLADLVSASINYDALDAFGYDAIATIAPKRDQ